MKELQEYHPIERVKPRARLNPFVHVVHYSGWQIFDIDDGPDTYTLKLLMYAVNLSIPNVFSVAF